MAKKKKTAAVAKQSSSIISKSNPDQTPPVRSIQAATRIQHFTGPLPPPEILNAYNQTIPGSAERIISLWEEQVRHRQGLERSVIDSDIKDSKIGMVCGFVVSLTAIVAGAICIMNGFTLGGTIMGGAALPALVGVFIYGSRQRRQEREQRFREDTKQ